MLKSGMASALSALYNDNDVQTQAATFIYILVRCDN